jgi:hypothetical protein
MHGLYVYLVNAVNGMEGEEGGIEREKKRWK